MRSLSALEQWLAEPRYRVHICHGPNCSARGSRSLAGQLSEELLRLDIAGEIEILETSCRNRCETGPSVNVYPGPTFYRGVTPDVLRRIAESHLANDIPVQEFTVLQEQVTIDLSKIKFDF
jgi:(2Fe-2S) ferredoxin